MQGFVKTIVSVPDIRIVPTFACLPELPPPSWFIRNQAWFIAVIILGCLFLALLAVICCLNRGARPSVIQVRGVRGEGARVHMLA